MQARRKILIVDDKAENLFALEKVLADTGAELIRCANGNDALAASLSHEFALAIIDVQMPRMDGYELAELLRSEEPARNIPIIFLSAVYSDDHHVFRGYAAGAVDFITKPFNPAALIGKVNVFLDLDRAREALQQSRDALEARVLERTSALRKANEALKAEVERRKKIEEELRLEEARFEALYELSQMTEASEKEMTAYVLDHQVKLTKSRLGWVGFLNEDGTACGGGSKSFASRCRVPDEALESAIGDGALWGSAVRRRKVTIVNDNAGPDSAEWNRSDGRIPFFRYMAVPLLDRERVVAVATVGNKDEPYNSSDAMHVSLLLDGLWKILKRKQTDEEQKRYTFQLEQSNRELEDFAFVASHDLQEPLRKIQIFASRLAGLSLPGREADYLERMQRTASRMQDLLLDLLKYSRITKKPEKILPVDLKRAVKEAVTDLTMLMEETEGHVDVGDLPTIEADAVQMRQLFQNLIGNGLKYCVECKPVVRVYTGRKCVNENCEIVVEDNGIGFDEAYVDRIFRPFQRLHGKLSCFRGTGMGLAICRRIVERHGGSITAKSSPGKGSVFIVTLPLKRPVFEALH